MLYYMKIIKNNLIINLACLSLFVLISTLYSKFDIAAYVCFLFLITTMFFLGKLKVFNKIEFLYLLLVFCTILSLLNSIDIRVSLVPSVYFIFIIIFTLALSKSVMKYSDFEKLLFYGLLGFVVISIRSFSEDFSSIRFSGIAGQPNALGLISGTGFIISFAYIHLFSGLRKFSILVSIFVLIASFFLVLASGSRGALISIVVPMIYIFLNNIRRNFKIIFMLTVILISTFITFYDKITNLAIYSRMLLLPAAIGLDFSNEYTSSEFSSAEDDTRLSIADIAFNAFLEHPLLGNGINTFSYYSDFVYTHNTYLEILFSQGLLGILLFSFFIYSVLTTKPNYNTCYLLKINKVKNFSLFYFIMAGFSIPNYQNKSQIIIYTLIIISTSFLYKGVKFEKGIV